MKILQIFSSSIMIERCVRGFMLKYQVSKSVYRLAEVENFKSYLLSRAKKNVNSWDNNNVE